MISYPVYKLVHFLGVFLAFVALAGLLGRAGAAAAGGDPLRRTLLALHGSGVFLVVLGGFGMMSRLGIPHTRVFPGWIWLKLGVWLAVALLALVPARRPAWARPALLSLPFLGALAAFLALFKPL